MRFADGLRGSKLQKKKKNIINNSNIFDAV